jgi:hypothetical protein
MAVKKTAEQIAAEAKQKAVNEITKAAPGLANPERYVTAKNAANILGAREAYIKENLKLDPTRFKAGNYNIATASKLAAEVNPFKEKGVANAESFIGKNLVFDKAKAEEALIRDVYKLNPATFAATGTVPDTSKQPVFDRTTGKMVQPTINVVKYDIATAAKRFEENKPTVVAPEKYPENFTQAVNNYSNAFQTAISKGIQNLNDADRANIQKYGKIVRDFSGKNISQNQQNIIDRINDVDTEIANYDAQKQIVTQQAKKIRGTPEFNKLTAAEKEKVKGNPDATTLKKLRGDRETLIRLEATAKNLAPRFQESFSRYGLSDVVQGIGGRAADLASVDTRLANLRANKVIATDELSGKLNSQLTDDQILNDINTARKNEYKSLYDIGTAASTDLQSQITQANKFLSDLQPNDPRRVSTQKEIDSLNAELAEAQKDTLEAKNLFENYQPVSGEQATSAISKVRESLRLPEERTLRQIDEIDPTIGATVRGLSRKYQEMVETPLGPTTTKQTEELRNQIEQEALNQLRLGSTLGVEEARQYEQAARSAQTARGNIFGLGPAVQEAANIGAAAEQRKLARYGAATAFLGSGETTGAATARDLGLRNALEQSRLGAAQGFIASGPTMYNLASQRLGSQQAMLNNYLAASAPQATGGFQATPSAANPYAYVNPNAGFIGAQNAASIYNTLADLQASQYGSQVGAIAGSYRSPGQEFASFAGGISGFSGLFGSPGSSAFFRG